MGTIKLFNGRNNFLSSYVVHIPYYIFLGCSRSRDATAAAQAFEREAGNKLGQGRGGLLTPLSPFTTSPWSPADKGAMAPPEEFSLGPSVIAHKGWTESIRDVGAPLSPFHYQLRKVSWREVIDRWQPRADCKGWRVPYLEEKIHEQFRTHIYGWVSC
jgi:betaine lipid synthase